MCLVNVGSIQRLCDRKACSAGFVFLVLRCKRNLVGSRMALPHHGFTHVLQRGDTRVIWHELSEETASLDPGAELYYDEDEWDREKHARDIYSQLSWCNDWLRVCLNSLRWNR